MMDVEVNGREVVVRLVDDVWQLDGPGTIVFTTTQAQLLRRSLNALDSYQPLDMEPEDG